MIGIVIAAKDEWKAVLDKYNIKDLEKYPFGEYFKLNIYDTDVIVYRSDIRKMNASGATQYMIDHFNLKKVIVVGTCAGIDGSFKTFDVFFPNKFVQYDCTVKESEPLIEDKYAVELNIDEASVPNTGMIATADRPVVMWQDYKDLKDNDVTIADMESAATAYVCKVNNVEFVAIKGISDFAIDESTSTIEDSYKDQFDTYTRNTPIVVNNILDNYLEYAIKNHFEYKSY